MKLIAPLVVTNLCDRTLKVEVADNCFICNVRWLLVVVSVVYLDCVAC